MKISVEKSDLDLLLQVYSQFLIEENQHNNLRQKEKIAISRLTGRQPEEITSEFILTLSGYR